MSIVELNSVAKDLVSVRQMIEKLQAEAEALADKLKTAMIEQGTEALQGDGGKATWRNVNSSRFDSKSFKADHAGPVRRLQQGPPPQPDSSSVYEKGRLSNRRPKQIDKRPQPPTGGGIG